MTEKKKMSEIEGREKLVEINSWKPHLSNYEVWRIAPGDATKKQCVKIPHRYEMREQIKLKFLTRCCEKKIDWTHGYHLDSICLEKEAVVFRMYHERYGLFDVTWHMRQAWRKRQTLAYCEGQDLVLLLMRIEQGANSYLLRIELTDDGYTAEFCNYYRASLGPNPRFAPVIPMYENEETLQIGAQLQTIPLRSGRIVGARLSQAIEMDDGCAPCCSEDVDFLSWFTLDAGADSNFIKSCRKGLPQEDGWVLSAIRVSVLEIHLDFTNGTKQATLSGAVSGDFRYWPYVELGDMVILKQSEDGEMSQVRIAVNPGRDYGCNLGYTAKICRVVWKPRRKVALLENLSRRLSRNLW